VFDRSTITKAGSGTVTPAATGSPITFTMPDDDVTVNVQFTDPPAGEKTIYVTPPSHGNVVPDLHSANPSVTITLTVVPDDGYRLKEGSLKVNGSGTGVGTVNDTTYTFTMPDADVTVSAEFELKPYTIHLPTTFPHGTVTMSPVKAGYYYGDTVTFNAVPEDGYQLSTLVYKQGSAGTPISIFGSKSFTITWDSPTDIYIEAAFAKRNFTVAASATMANGTLLLNKSSAQMGDTVTVTVNPAATYRLKAGSLVFNGTGYSNVGITAGGPVDYTFTMVPANLVVSAQFEEIPDLNITFPGFGPQTVNLTSTAANLAKEHNDILTVSLQAGQTAAGWTLDGDIIMAGTQPFTGSSRQFRAVDLSEGIHYISVAVSSGGKPYSNEVIFRVTGAVYYTVQSAAGISNGTLSFNAASAPQGAQVVVTPAPGTGHRLKAGTLEYSGGGVTNQAISGPPYTFAMPPGDVTVTAQFELIPVLSVTFTGFGDESITLSPAGSRMSKAQNDTLTVTATPQSGQTIAGWTLDGEFIMEEAQPFTGSSRQFRAVDLSVGEHYVAVALTQGETPYSKEIHFTVEE
jgi:hypothetical protein